MIYKEPVRKWMHTYLGVRFNNGLWEVIITNYSNLYYQNNGQLEEVLFSSKDRKEAVSWLKKDKWKTNGYRKLKPFEGNCINSEEVKRLKSEFEKEYYKNDA